jgi:hypothetical protein
VHCADFFWEDLFWEKSIVDWLLICHKRKVLLTQREHFDILCIVLRTPSIFWLPRFQSLGGEQALRPASTKNFSCPLYHLRTFTYVILKSLQPKINKSGHMLAVRNHISYRTSAPKLGKPTPFNSSKSLIGWMENQAGNRFFQRNFGRPRSIYLHLFVVLAVMMERTSGRRNQQRQRSTTNTVE